MGYAKTFQPIESDPEILTKLMHGLGISSGFQFEDVLDYQSESEMSALALIVIFPESEEDEQLKAMIEAERTAVVAKNMTFLKQTIDNSCGLIAVLHCVLNTAAAESILPGSLLYHACRSTQGVTGFLGASRELESVYQAAVESGESDISENVNYHYVALVTCDGHLYELDGERSSPFDRGALAEAGFILKNPEQIVKIVNSLAGGRFDCSVYKLTQPSN